MYINFGLSVKIIYSILIEGCVYLFRRNREVIPAKGEAT